MRKKFKFQIRLDNEPWMNYSAQEQKRAETVFANAKAKGWNVTFHAHKKPIFAHDYQANP